MTTPVNAASPKPAQLGTFFTTRLAGAVQLPFRPVFGPFTVETHGFEIGAMVLEMALPWASLSMSRPVAASPVDVGPTMATPAAMQACTPRPLSNMFETVIPLRPLKFTMAGVALAAIWVPQLLGA